ncbi:MAG: 2'-5' RNA ligase family protein [Treponema sp.]|nr:2'-5' RNA ligase family protein [Treponema sp.]
MKKHNASQFFSQTHFIGVIPSEEITFTLEDCRRYMRETYGCKSGHGTPIHVTLVPPFLLPKEFTIKMLVDNLAQNLSLKKLSFTASVQNFASFAERTIFAKVEEQDEWKTLQNIVYKSLPISKSFHIKKSTSFIPHLTVSNRDIPNGVVQNALSVLNELNFLKTFVVDNVTIFERNGKRWEEAATIPLL